MRKVFVCIEDFLLSRRVGVCVQKALGGWVGRWVGGLHMESGTQRAPTGLFHAPLK